MPCQYADDYLQWRLWVIFFPMPWDQSSEFELEVQSSRPKPKFQTVEVHSSLQGRNQFDSIIFSSPVETEGRRETDLQFNSSVLCVKYCVTLGTLTSSQFPVSGYRKPKVHSSNSSSFDSIIFQSGEVQSSPVERQ